MQKSVAKAEQVSVVLKDLDQKICAYWPAEIPAEVRSRVLDEHGKAIAHVLDALGGGPIESVAHAVFHEYSKSPAHREAARRWFAERAQEAKKVRFVYDRFDALARLKRLNDAMSGDPAQDNRSAAPAEPSTPNMQLQLGPSALQLLFMSPDIHGDYPAAAADLVRRLRQDRCYVVLAFPPKCGGTFIRDVVGRLCGAGPSPIRFGHALGGRDVSPYLPLIAAQLTSPTGPKAFMTHAHMVGYHSNIQLLNLFGLKPVVMKRSIPDMLCSFADMVQTEGARVGGYNWSLLCGVHTDEGFLALDPAARLDFFVFHQAPWYIQFYASWLRADRKGEIPVHWTDYDAFREDPSRTIAGILEFYGHADKVPGIPEALATAQANKARLRFNRGVSGRGVQALGAEHMNHLHRLAAGYPDIDFVGEGLLPAPTTGVR